MAGMKTVFDTDVLGDFLTGVAAARDALHRLRERAISVVTWAALLVGAADEVEADRRLFLNGFTVIDVNTAVAEGAASIRRARRIELPDAPIQATAETLGALLVTRNTKDFPPDAPASVCPAPADGSRREPTVRALKPGSGVVVATTRRYTTWVV